MLRLTVSAFGDVLFGFCGLGSRVSFFDVSSLVERAYHTNYFPHFPVVI